MNTDTIAPLPRINLSTPHLNRARVKRRALPPPMNEEQEQTLIRAVTMLISQVEELSASHVALTRFFLSKWPSLSEDERRDVANAVDGLEVRQWHLRDELRNLQDTLLGG